LKKVWNLEQKTKRSITCKIKKTRKGFRILKRKKLMRNLKESEMYRLGEFHGQQAMRKRMLEQLARLISGMQEWPELAEDEDDN
jgi:hypothetical protein|tara:strand:- start:172 stop:423 length:252 start_codon:yes stop_codon:yes gene_type:complete